MSELAEIVIHFVSNGGIVPRKAVACSRLKTGQVVGGLAFFFWREWNACRDQFFVLE